MEQQYKFKQGQVICHPSGERDIVFTAKNLTGNETIGYSLNGIPLDEYELQPIINITAFVGNDLYHTMKDRLLKTQNSINYWESTITGWHKGELVKEGELVVLNRRYMKIEEVMERRNHAGNFPDPEDKKNSFFKVRVSYQLPVGVN